MYARTHILYIRTYVCTHILRVFVMSTERVCIEQELSRKQRNKRRDTKAINKQEEPLGKAV